MMTLTTSISGHSEQDDNSIMTNARGLLNTIRTFATDLSSIAFWDAVSAKAPNCIVVYGNRVELEEAMVIKCNDIENVVGVWCKDIAEYLRDLSREDDLCKSLDVEINHVEWRGGLHITCTNEDKEQPFVLWILPIKEGEHE